MKTIYTVRTWAVMLLVSFATALSAQNVITVEGSSQDDFVNALESAVTGDTILLTNDIDLYAEVTIDKYVVIKGIEKSGGSRVMFKPDGNVKTRFFTVNKPEGEEDGKTVFMNLGIMNAYAEGEDGDGDGGAIRFGPNVNAEFRLCFFEANEGFRGGAFWAQAEYEGAPAVINLKFYGCDFMNNSARNRGGVFFAGNLTSIDAEYCIFRGNKTLNTGEPRGGVMFLEGEGTYRFFGCQFEANVTYSNRQEGDGDLEGGGAVTCTAGPVTVNYDRCSFVSNNNKGNHGSVLFAMNAPKITFLNSTIAGNYNGAHSGTFFLASAPGFELWLVNTTMAGNQGVGNIGNTNSIRVMNATDKIHIWNSLLVGNLIDDGTAADIGITGGSVGVEGNILDIRNSVVGAIYGAESFTTSTDNSDLNPSLINMYPIDPLWMDLDQSGISWGDELQSTVSKNNRFYKMYYYSLTGNDAYATGLGDPALLAEYDTNKDMLRQTRTVKDGAIWAGAVQNMVGYVRNHPLEAPTLYWDPEMGSGVGIKAPATTAGPDIRVNSVVNNGQLYVNFGELKGQAKLELYSIDGKRVQNVGARNVIGTQPFALDAQPGLYILKVTVAGKSFAKRLIVK